MGEAPVEYDDARNSLVSFRKKVFNETVSGRVKALLDANHETLEKYGSVIDRLSVVPYMFGNVRQKALALRLGGKDVGVGEIAQSKAVFSIDKGTYPNTTPFNVPPRKLPQVDIFMYEPPTDVTLIEKTSEAVWSSLFLLQSDKNVFSDIPDTENAFFDYFKFNPIGRVKVEVTLLEPEPPFTDWVKLSGEATILVRDLTPVGGAEYKTYDIYVLVDANFYNVTNEIGIVPLAMFVTSETALNPSAVIIAGGKRLLNTDKGVFASWVAEGQLLGWTKTHNGYAIIKKEVVKAVVTFLTIAVNDSSLGMTDPPPAVYEKYSTDEVTVTAIPYTGCAVKNWELDGIQYPPSDTFLVKCYHDHTLICVFWIGGTLVMRPIANGDVIELKAWGDSPNYKCVDEDISDGDATVVHHKTYDEKRYDLYQLSNPAISEGAIIDYVDVFARVRTKNPIAKHPVNLVIKTNGVVVHDMLYFPDMAYMVISKRFTLNPVTGVAWNKSEVDALQAGVRLYYKQLIPVPEPYDGICTQVWAEVRYHTEPAPETMSDDFNDNMLDPSKWVVKKFHKASEIDIFERNQRLEVALNVNDMGTSPKAGVRTKDMFAIGGRAVEAKFYMPNGVLDYARSHMLITDVDIPENIGKDPRQWLVENGKTAYCINVTPNSADAVEIDKGETTVLGTKSFGQCSYTGRMRAVRSGTYIGFVVWKNGEYIELGVVPCLFGGAVRLYVYLWSEDNRARSKIYGETDTWFDDFILE